MNKEIKCPECGAEIEISSVLTAQIENDIKISMRKENEKKIKEAVSSAEKKTKEVLSIELNDLKTKIQDSDTKLKIAKELELTLKQQEKEIEKTKERLEEEVEERVKAKEKLLRLEIAQKTKEETALELNDLKEQVKEKNDKADESQKKELELRKEVRILEEKEKDRELQMQRRLDKEKIELEETLSKRYMEANDLKLKERDKQINDLRKSLDEAKRKSEQGSMETQGEVLELDLECKLKAEFPYDTISPVPKGIKGADVIQEVKDSSLKDCGKIIWEAKNTKTWQSPWLQKLKDDQRDIGANIAILISAKLPEEINGFGNIDGVWVSDLKSYLPLALALRDQLIQVSFTRNAQIGKNEKMEMIFTYLSGNEFKQRVEAIVETFSSMNEQVAKERRAMEKIWKEREKQIQKITINTSGMYGEIKGIIGSSVAEIKALELDDGVDLLEDAEIELRE